MGEVLGWESLVELAFWLWGVVSRVEERVAQARVRIRSSAMKRVSLWDGEIV